MDGEQIVFVVDDDMDFRESLKWLLEGAGYEVCAYSSAEAFLEEYNGDSGCLLLDVRMTGMSGLALQQEMNDRDYCLPVIMITGHGDVAVAVQAMKNRAVDFIEKPFNDEALVKLVERALGTAKERFSAKSHRESSRGAWQTLSKREKQVAELVVGGYQNREIAQQLSISIKTVEIHRSRVMKKMKAKNLVELVGLLKRG